MLMANGKKGSEISAGILGPGHYPATAIKPLLHGGMSELLYRII